MNGNPNPALEEMREKLRIWEFFGCAEEGIFVEVGANDPKSLSQWYIPEDFLFYPPLYERLRLFRKMYLGTPVRALKFRLQSVRTRRGL